MGGNISKCQLIFKHKGKHKHLRKCFHMTFLQLIESDFVLIYVFFIYSESPGLLFQCQLIQRTFIYGTDNFS